MNWKSEQQRQTAIKALQVLSNTRTNKKGLIKYLEKIREEKGAAIYETESKIEETVDELVENPNFPIQRSSEGSFFERTDSGVTY